MSEQTQLGRVLLERYRIVRPLGMGGMGAVFEGLQLDLDRRVAIKLLRPELVADERSRKRFEREARLAARLEHPNLVQVTDFGVDDSEPFMVMEFVEGETLRAHMKSRGRLGWTESVEILEPLLRALAAVHRAEVVHRDLKPSNVLLVWDAGVVVPKLVDFGIARGEDDEKITRTHGTVGTAVYMAPEQIRAARLAGPAADQYSAAVMFYEMLSGALPHTGGSGPELAAAKLMREPTPLAEHVEGLPPHGLDAVMRALSLEPAARYADVSALRAALLNESPPKEAAPRVRAQTLPQLETLETLETTVSEGEEPSTVGPPTPPVTGPGPEPAPPDTGAGLEPRPRSRLPIALSAAVALLLLAAWGWSQADRESAPPAPPVDPSAGSEAAPPRAEAAHAQQPAPPEPSPSGPSVNDPTAAVGAGADPEPAPPEPAPPALPPAPPPRAHTPRLPPPTAVRAERGAIHVSGYDSWSAGAHLAGGQARLDRCVEGARLRAGQTAEVRLVIAADGELVETRGLGGAPRGLVQCVQRAMRRVRWSPPVAGAGEVTVTYALEP